MAKRSLSQRIRIIGGQHRGRKLSFVEQSGLRPTGDRVRETLFNWLQPIIRGANCLDVFAGSGALGFEAYSRGAERVILLELTTAQVKQLQSHQHLLQAKGLEVYQTNALNWLSEASVDAFDVIFLDPPFADELLQTSVDLIHQHHRLAHQGYLYIEADSQTDWPCFPDDWVLKKEKIMGQVKVCLLQKQ